MKTYSHIWIYAALVTSFVGYKGLEYTGYTTPFLNGYFEDLLTMPIFLKTGLLSLQVMNKNWRTYQILKRDIILLTVLTGVYFEWIIPLYDQRFTSDMLDFIAYATGATFFLIFLNKPLSYQLRNS